MNAHRTKMHVVLALLVCGVSARGAEDHAGEPETTAPPHGLVFKELTDTNLPEIFTRRRDELVERKGGELRSHDWWLWGLAVFDYDRDGDLDLAISTFHSQARLFRNDAPPPDHSWLTVELVGDPQRSVNRDAIGAQLVVTDENGLYVWRAITGGDGYLSMQSLPLEFGLGDSKTVDLEILWPNGETQSLEDVRTNRTIRVHQGRTGFETRLLE